MKFIDNAKRCLILCVAVAGSVVVVPNVHGTESETAVCSSFTAKELMENGRNEWFGEFKSQGRTYMFSISFTYNRRTGQVTNAVFENVDTNFRCKIQSMTLSANGNSVTITGPNLSLKVRFDGYANFTGSMTEGRKTGTCTINIAPCG